MKIGYIDSLHLGVYNSVYKGMFALFLSFVYRNVGLFYLSLPEYCSKFTLQ